MASIVFNDVTFNLVLLTLENQIKLLREMGVNTPVSVQTSLAKSNGVRSLHSNGDGDDDDDANAHLQELESLRIENEKLRAKIETMVTEFVSPTECQEEYRKGFNDGLKAAQQEMIVSEMMPKEISPAVAEALLDEPVAHKIEEETVPDIDDEQERADMDEEEHAAEDLKKHEETTVVEQAQEAAEEEQEEEQEATEEEQEAAEEEQESAEEEQESAEEEQEAAEEEQEATEEEQESAEEEQESAEEEQAEEELQEVEFNGKTYYYHEETGQIFLPTNEGEVDLEAPVGCWSEKKGTFVLFKRST